MTSIVQVRPTLYSTLLLLLISVIGLTHSYDSTHSIDRKVSRILPHNCTQHTSIYIIYQLKGEAKGRRK